jgi:hypothetical protein
VQKHSKLKKAGIVLLILAIPLTLLFVDWFVYPLKTTHPNYSDVNRVFNKMTFPSDWKVVSTSENKGTAGRACPIESESVCYHKSVTYQVPIGLTNDAIQKILEQTGCPSPAFSETNSDTPGRSFVNYRCSIDAVEVTGTLYKKQSNWEASFYVST